MGSLSSPQVEDLREKVSGMESQVAHLNDMMSRLLSANHSLESQLASQKKRKVRRKSSERQTRDRWAQGV